MSPEVIISLIALFIALLSFVHSWISKKRDDRINPMMGYLVQIAQIEAKVGEIPSALEFHGISPDELKEKEITPEEFAYLVASFTAGGAWFEAYSNEDISSYKEGSYRWNICAAPKTQRSWPLLKRMMDDTPYRRKVEATIIAASKKVESQI